MIPLFDLDNSSSLPSAEALTLAFSSRRCEEIELSGRLLFSNLKQLVTDAIRVDDSPLSKKDLTFDRPENTMSMMRGKFLSVGFSANL